VLRARLWRHRRRTTGTVISAQTQGATCAADARQASYEGLRASGRRPRTGLCGPSGFAAGDVIVDGPCWDGGFKGGRARGTRRR